MIKIGIMGGAGYTAGELLRILLQHPHAQLQWVHSHSQAGKQLSEIHHDLIGETVLCFTNEAVFEEIDVLFLCVGHGEAKKIVPQYNLLSPTYAHLKIIDLSQDFRLKKEDNPFIYGLTELNKVQLKNTQYVANAGCFATCIELALLPLAKQQALKSAVHIQAVTGSTGAGQQPTESTHFSWRNNNVSVYKAFTHQHNAEILQTIRQLQPDFSADFFFIPVRGNFSRGIFATLYTEFNGSLEEAYHLYQDFYGNAQQVIITHNNPDLKIVVNTNKTVIYLEKHNNMLLIISMIDNLLKGASGQAVQNMNVLFGLPEYAGLQLKAVGF
jgi:N-acetyl-gamma-glutamyl-phosphate reductase